MLLYSVTWRHSKILSKGKGRATSKETHICFNVVCRNNHDALRCLDYHFRFVFSKDNKHGLTLDDGSIELKRSVIDSRGFDARYLMLDGMKEPFNLIDVKSNYVRYNTLYNV